ncbi:MAG: hypothetical protein ACQEV6_12440 [Pseudomonadota bacterium]
MLRNPLKLIVWVTLAMVLAACSKPDTPQEVAAAFWQAMADNDAGDVVEYSTLTSADDFDQFQRDWADVVPSFGRVVIDNADATIVTRLPAENGGISERREVITYLVEQDGQWLVDYARTGDAVMNPSPFSGLMGQLSEIGERLTARFSSSSDDMEQRLNEMARELEAYSEAMSRRAEEAVNDYGQILREYMEQLEESVNRALEEHRRAPERDRNTLEQAANDLERSGEELAEPTLEALANASRTLADTGERLAATSAEAFERDREEWAAKLREIREHSEQFFRELQDSLNSDN